MPLFGSSIRRTNKGDYELRLETWERSLLRSLPGQLRDLLATDDPALERLFPPAYSNDAERSAEFARLMRDDLLASRMSSLELMEATIDATRIDEEHLVAWMGALNDLRLVLGTRLEVTEEMYEDELDADDPRGPAMAVYGYLGMLQEQVVVALSASL